MRGLAPTVLIALAGCATYQARPLLTSGAAVEYNARRLDAPALRAALDSAGMRPSPAGWRDWELAEAAWVLRPERARLEAELRVAEAARITAGAREKPGINTETEYSFSGTHGESRWGLALSSVFTLELGGKRGARLGRANAGVLVAAAHREAEAWAVRWRVHEAAVRWALAERRLGANRDERDETDSLLVQLGRRFEEGAISASDLARSEADRQEAGAELAAREREVSEARAVLAGTIGIPLTELERTALAVDPPEDCDSARRDSLQELALDARQALRQSLAEYQLSEAEVRLAVAGSWPDLQLGPGLFFDHGVGKWTIGFGLPSLPLHGNRGPIAEAEARREVAAHRVAEAQQLVLDEMEQAIAGCAAATAESEALDMSPARRRLELAEAAYRRGESGRLEVVLARLEVARSGRRLTEARGRVALARLALERATGRWGPTTAVAAGKEGK